MCARPDRATQRTRGGARESLKSRGSRHNAENHRLARLRSPRLTSVNPRASVALVEQSSILVLRNRHRRVSRDRVEEHRAGIAAGPPSGSVMSELQRARALRHLHAGRKAGPLRADLSLRAMPGRNLDVSRPLGGLRDGADMINPCCLCCRQDSSSGSAARQTAAECPTASTRCPRNAC